MFEWVELVGHLPIDESSTARSWFNHNQECIWPPIIEVSILSMDMRTHTNDRGVNITTQCSWERERGAQTTVIMHQGSLLHSICSFCMFSQSGYACVHILLCTSFCAICKCVYCSFFAKFFMCSKPHNIRCCNVKRCIFPKSIKICCEDGEGVWTHKPFSIGF